jgi:hypothetical protein
MRRETTIWVRTLAVVVGLATTVSADRLELRTGDVFFGTILRVTEDSVSIQLESGGILSFRTSGVRLIQRKIRGTDTSEIILDRRGDPGEVDDPKNASIRPLLSPPPAKDDPAAKEPTTSPGHNDGPPFSTQPGIGGERTVSRPPGKPLLASRVSSPKHGVSVAPPRSYAPWDGARSAKVPMAFKNARNGATFVVEWQVSTSSVEEVKNHSLRDYSDRFRVFHVVRDGPLPAEGSAGGAPAGWILEVESHVGMLAIRQIQVFYKQKSEVFVLTYSGAAKGFDGLRPAIEASLESFRFDRVVDLDAPEQPARAAAGTAGEAPLGY